MGGKDILKHPLTQKMMKRMAGAVRGQQQRMVYLMLKALMLDLEREGQFVVTWEKKTKIKSSYDETKGEIGTAVKKVYFVQRIRKDSPFWKARGIKPQHCILKWEDK